MVEWLSGLKQKFTKFQCVKAPKVRILVQPINFMGVSKFNTDVSLYFYQ